jgi:hypothetical protein
MTEIDLVFTHKKLLNHKLLVLQNNQTLNINFSVALYETLFLLVNNLKDEKEAYEL